MSIGILDIIIIILFALLMLGIGLYYRRYSNRNVSSYFLGGRKLPWWLAGISMVATTFAADTPLAVAELVHKGGIAGNWLWWNFLAGGMLTTFFFSRLWRKAKILTDLEFIELRYSGKPAAFLRAFKAIYLGIFMNALIIGWVNLALLTIIQVFFNTTYQEAFVYLAIAMVVVAVYSSISGLMGVTVTDFLQFFIAMGGTTLLAYYVLRGPEIGGISGLVEKLPDATFSFFPSIADDATVGSFTGSLTLSVGAFLAFIGLQWWSSWYPGADPGGGGYIAQRMMSAKNEQHAIAATLFFQIMHYCVRPWPWILVGLATIILYPELEGSEKRLGYVMAMRDYLPAGLKGVLLIAFFSAYMSTLSSQLNWGASYLVNDLYKRFIDRDAGPKKLVKVSQVSTIIMMLVALLFTPFMRSIAEVWLFTIEFGAGLGLVLILRWYWWRINAWSEITATIVPFIVYLVGRFYFHLTFPNSFFVTMIVTTVAWIVVTYCTAPTDMDVLKKFYARVEPSGAWRPVRELLGIRGRQGKIKSLILCWISSIAMTYGILFLIGYVIFSQWNNAFVMLSVISGSFVILAYHSKKINIFGDEKEQANTETEVD
ncbi:MAG TPA: sodium:solute symporter family protein, partial [Cytophagaceae bacterium]